MTGDAACASALAYPYGRASVSSSDTVDVNDSRGRGVER